MYVTFLAGTLKPERIGQYVNNIIGILHLEAGYSNLWEHQVAYNVIATTSCEV